MRKLKSCGFIIFRIREGNEVEFLLMKQRNRYDLCKGHYEERDMTEKNTAFRELMEETSISKKEIVVDSGFKFTQTYYPRYKRFGGEKVEKTIVIFLGMLLNPRKKLKLTEHVGFEWLKFKNEGNVVQKNTVDPLLKQLEYDHLLIFLIPFKDNPNPTDVELIGKGWRLMERRRKSDNYS